MFIRVVLFQSGRSGSPDPVEELVTALFAQVNQRMGSVTASSSAGSAPLVARGPTDVVVETHPVQFGPNSDAGNRFGLVHFYLLLTILNINFSPRYQWTGPSAPWVGVYFVSPSADQGRSENVPAYRGYVRYESRSSEQKAPRGQKCCRLPRVSGAFRLSRAEGVGIE